MFFLLILNLLPVDLHSSSHVTDPCSPLPSAQNSTSAEEFSGNPSLSGVRLGRGGGGRPPFLLHVETLPCPSTAGRVRAPLLLWLRLRVRPTFPVPSLPTASVCGSLQDCPRPTGAPFLNRRQVWDFLSPGKCLCQSLMCDWESRAHCLQTGLYSRDPWCERKILQPYQQTKYARAIKSLVAAATPQ